MMKRALAVLALTAGLWGGAALGATVAAARGWMPAEPMVPWTPPLPPVLDGQVAYPLGSLTTPGSVPPYEHRGVAVPLAPMAVK